MHTHLDRRWIWIIGTIVGVIVIASAVTYFLNSERVRAYAESQMNRHLTDYSVRIGEAHFNPTAFSLLLENVVLTQNAHPDPPVANIRALKASLHWSDLLRLRVVAEFRIDHPELFINLAHVRSEEDSPVPLEKKGWQDAVEAIYPIKINNFKVLDGEITYVDQGPYKPLKASNIDLVASNIRNIKYADNVFPSAVSLDGNIFESGKLSLKGRANFLQQPHMSFKGTIDLVDMDLSYLEPILRRKNLSIRSGTLSTKGDLEYTPEASSINVDRVLIENLAADYLHLPQTARAEKQRIDKTAEAAGKYSNAPTMQMRVNELRIENSAFAYVDRTADPNYRIFFTDIAGSLSGFSNQLEEGPSKLDLQGRFMGSGHTRIDGTFRPKTKQADLALKVAIEDTEIRTMQNMFRSAVNVDVESGLFSFYSEMRIRNNHINGWVKPMFKNLEIGERKDNKKGILHKAYVGTVKALAKVLENKSKDQVATVTDISGPISDPDASIMQVISRLVSNAWIRAILPGFQSEASKEQGS